MMDEAAERVLRNSLAKLRNCDLSSGIFSPQPRYTQSMKSLKKQNRRRMLTATQTPKMNETPKSRDPKTHYTQKVFGMHDVEH